MEQGFAPSTVGKMTRNASNTTPVAGARGALRNGQHASGQDTVLNIAQGVRSTANLPFMLMLPALPMSMIGWVANKFNRHRTTVAIGGTADALMHQMRETKGKDAFQLAGDMVQRVADKAGTVGGRAAHWEAPLASRAEALRTGGAKLQTTLGRTLAPVGKVLESGLHAVKLHAPVMKGLGVLGRLPVGASIAGVAATAGITAIWLTKAKESREFKATLGEMREQLGANHPLVGLASKIEKKQGLKGFGGGVLETANEAAFVAFEAVPTMGMGAMMGQVALMQAGQLLVKENATANAFASLKAADAGELKVDANQKAFWVQQLIGGMPAAQAKGGARNHLAAGMAKELVTSNASFATIMETLRDQNKFVALQEKAAEKQQAVAAAAPVAEKHPTMLHAAAPVAKVNGIQSQGRIIQAATQEHAAPAAHASHTARVESTASPEAQHTGR